MAGRGLAATCFIVLAQSRLLQDDLRSKAFDDLVKTGPVVYKATATRELTHVGAPFTQGLELVNATHLLETSGAFPTGTKSMIRLLDMDGNVVKSTEHGLENRFAEGATRIPEGWLVTTYHDHKAVKYNEDLDYIGEVHYPEEEGWGLAHSPTVSRFLATNGSQYMMELSRNSLEVERTEAIRCLGHEVHGINELELVQDFQGEGSILFGNLYQTRLVLGLDPLTFECKVVFNLEGFGEYTPTESQGYHVANGIAQLPNGHFMVTGKNWQKMFEIELTSSDSDSHSAAELSKLELKLSQSLLLMQTDSGLHHGLSQIPLRQPGYIGTHGDSELGLASTQPDHFLRQAV